MKLITIVDLQSDWKRTVTYSDEEFNSVTAQSVQEIYLKEALNVEPNVKSVVCFLSYKGCFVKCDGVIRNLVLKSPSPCLSFVHVFMYC